MIIAMLRRSLPKSLVAASVLCALATFGCLPDPLERYPETSQDKAALHGAECKAKETKVCTCSDTLEEGVQRCQTDGTFEEECWCGKATSPK